MGWDQPRSVSKNVRLGYLKVTLTPPKGQCTHTRSGFQQGASLTFGKSWSHCTPLHWDDRTSLRPLQRETWVDFVMTTDLTNISFTLSPAILLKAYTYKYLTMQSIEILLKKNTEQKNLVEPSPWQPPPLVLVQKDGLPPLPHLQFVWSLFGLKNCRLFKRVFLSPAPSATRPSNCFTASGTSGSCKKSMNIGLDLSRRLQTRPGRLEVVQWPTAGSDMIFVQNFTLPDFQAKNFTPQKA